MNRQYFSYNKYKNKSCTCHAGHNHDSRFEARYCDQLGLLVMAKEIKGYETQKTFDLKVNGKKICGHRVDFLVETNDDKQEVHECKGFATAEWKIKHKLFEANYPEIKYIVVIK
jgi:hypothetical protein